MATATPEFNPFWSLAEYGGEPDQSGINWSYAKFPSEETRASFIAACNANGFRTRGNIEKNGLFLVQYHHYQD